MSFLGPILVPIIRNQGDWELIYGTAIQSH